MASLREAVASAGRLARRRPSCRRPRHVGRHAGGGRPAGPWAGSARPVALPAGVSSGAGGSCVRPGPPRQVRRGVPRQSRRLGRVSCRRGLPVGGANPAQPRVDRDVLGSVGRRRGPHRGCRGDAVVGRARARGPVVRAEPGRDRVRPRGPAGRTPCLRAGGPAVRAPRPVAPALRHHPRADLLGSGSGAGRRRRRGSRARAHGRRSQGPGPARADGRHGSARWRAARPGRVLGALGRTGARPAQGRLVRHPRQAGRGACVCPAG